ncbi:hypothetical protein [Streptomyces cacaoi]|uniref:hypothetical protein n=1 Tax=Streptomyces cacaoi TaxID=1898 RepID=UPI0011F207CB|nr:hypothetical protein [Streptomyces cacaoi]
MSAERPQPVAGCVPVDIDACGDEAVRECADVLYGSSAHSARELLRRYPGCLVVTLRHPDGSCCVVTRTGGRRVPPPAGRLPDAGHRRLAVRVHAGLASGLSLETVLTGCPPPAGPGHGGAPGACRCHGD